MHCTYVVLCIVIICAGIIVKVQRKYVVRCRCIVIMLYYLVQWFPMTMLSVHDNCPIVHGYMGHMLREPDSQIH